MTTGTQIVAKARSYLGQHEVPMGSNSGPFVLACQRDTFLPGTGWPWCAAFICHVAAECGVRLAYASASAHDLADHHIASRQTSHTAVPGDVVDFNIGSGHTGILVAIHHAESSVTTIDGNCADKVSEVVHPLSVVRGFWRIPGVHAAPAPAPRRLPLFTIATSASGHRKILFRARHKRRVVRWMMHHTLSRVAPNGITISRPKR